MEVPKSPPQVNEENHPAALDQLLRRDENNDLSSFFPLSPAQREDSNRQQIKNGEKKPMDSSVGFSGEDQAGTSVASRHRGKGEVKMTKETFPSSPPPQKRKQERSPADRSPKTPSKEGIKNSTSFLASSFSLSNEGDRTHLQKDTEKHEKHVGGLKKEGERLPSYESGNGILSSGFKPPPAPKKTVHQDHEPRRNLSKVEERKKRGEESFLHTKKKGFLSSSCARSSSRSSTTTDSCETRDPSASFSSSSLSSSSSSLSVLTEKEGGGGGDRQEVSKRNFIKENARSAGQYRSRRRFHESSCSQQKRHENFGKIPEYLTQIKNELQEKQKREMEEEKIRNLPPGMRMLSHEERMDLLTKIKAEQRAAEDELSRMPIAIKTLQQRRYIESLERKLIELHKQEEKLSKPNILIEI